MGADNPFVAIQDLSAGYFASRCLHVVAELGVADALDEAGMRVERLAEQTGADPDALARILRLLQTHGVFGLQDGVVTHTPASRLLRSDDPRSLRDFTRMFGLTLNWRSAELLLEAVRTGTAAAPRAFEGGFWARLEQHPEEARIFDSAMTAKAMGQVGAITAAYDFSGFRHVVDVGGGQGHLIRAILRACPEVRGTLFDLPHVVEAARGGGDEGGRLAFQGGDFFKDRLPEADAYILMEIIHDWADAPAAEILAGVRASAPAGAKLLIIETEVPEGPGPDWSKTLDIVMLTLFAARQRTAEEYRVLLEGQGFEIRRAIDTGAGISVFEAQSGGAPVTRSAGGLQSTVG
ncbi:methyltransferase [Phenylobacterium terrae]|uniref:Methyltransferase n=1 Tax=Phenylobacterium terrae TaxID=2665495 RepID=A0ABW4MXI0_9CAUL